MRLFWRRSKNNPRALEMGETELKRLASSGKKEEVGGSFGGATAAEEVAGAVAMVCRDFVCQRAAKSAGELRAQLQKAAAANRGVGGARAAGGVKLTEQKVPFA